MPCLGAIEGERQHEGKQPQGRSGDCAGHGDLVGALSRRPRKKPVSNDRRTTPIVASSSPGIGITSGMVCPTVYAADAGSSRGAGDRVTRAVGARTRCALFSGGTRPRAAPSSITHWMKCSFVTAALFSTNG